MIAKCMVIAEICPQNASVLADTLVGKSAQKSVFGLASMHAVGQLGADPTEGSSSGPRAGMFRVADNAATVEQMQRFEASSSRSNGSKSCDLSLKSAAAGIR